MPNTTLLVFGDCPNNPLTMPLNYDTMGIVQRQSLTNTKGENMNIYITKTADGYTMAIALDNAAELETAAAMGVNKYRRFSGP